MGSWEAQDKDGELRTYRHTIDAANAKSIDWLQKFLEKSRLQLTPGKAWRKPNISVRDLNLPSDLIDKLSEEVKLEKKTFFVWANDITLSFDGVGKLFLDIKTPNVWLSADLLTIGNPSNSDNGFSILGLGIDIAATTGGVTGAATGNMFTFGKKIIKVTTEKKLLSKLEDLKGKLWGMVVYAHGSEKGGITRVSQPERIELNQRQLIAELQKYGYKLSKIYMMQCYSGYKGEIVVVDRKISNPTISPRVKKIAESYYENCARKIFNSSYEKVTSVKIVPQEDKSGYKLVVKTKINWAVGWESVGIYTYTYTGINAGLIDWGNIILDPCEWF